MPRYTATYGKNMMKSIVVPKLYGIIGDPVQHSLSPFLHTAAFQRLQIPGILLPWQISKANLATFMTAFPLLHIEGCCVTIPHKKAILPFLSALTPSAQKTGAVNTLFWKNGVLWGDNTDVPGFIAPLQNIKYNPCAHCLILGSGGAARAAIIGLQMQGYQHLTLCSRTDEHAKWLAIEFGINWLPWQKREAYPADYIINATPVGMAGALEQETPYPCAGFKGRRGIAYDMVYTPGKTRFCCEAKKHGWQTLSGQTMFLAQANAQFERWTNHNLPKAVQKAALRAINTYPVS